MRIVKVPPQKEKGSGRYGKYFQVSSKKGIKVLSKGFKTIYSLRQSMSWNHAELEVTYLKKAEKSNITPKGAELVVAEMSGKYYAGILMEHIEGKTVFQSKLKVNQKQITNFVLSKMKKVGLVYTDLNKNNIIISSKGKFKIIDFSPDHIFNARINRRLGK